MLTQKRIKVNFHVFKLKFNFLIVCMVAKTQCLYCSSFHLEGQKAHRLQQCRSPFTGISSMGFPYFCQFYSSGVYFYYGLFIIHVSNQLFFLLLLLSNCQLLTVMPWQRQERSVYFSKLLQAVVTRESSA